MDTDHPIAIEQSNSQTEEVDLQSFPMWWLRSLKRILLTPTDFFQSLTFKRGLLVPFLFCVPGALLSVIPAASSRGSFSAFLTGVAWSVVNLPIDLFLTTVFVSITVAIFIHPGEASNGRIYRITAYTYGALALIYWIPYLGLPVLILESYLTIIGIKVLYSTSLRLAVATVVIPTIVLFALLYLMDPKGFMQFMT